MKARSTELSVTIGGADIGSEATKDILELRYTDCEDSEADDLSITIADAAGKWLEQWMDAAVQASAAYGVDGKGAVTIGATITRRNWTSDGDDSSLFCGSFALDSVSHGGPPGVITINGTSLPYDGGAREELRTQGWENYTLSGIAGEIASRSGLESLFLSDYDPSYEREEQSELSDIVFLQELCSNAGLSLKVTDGQIVIFDQQTQEAQSPVASLSRNQLEKWSFGTGECDTQYGGCRVSYYDTADGELKTASYTDPDAGEGDVRWLNLRRQCTSIGEAEQLAKSTLRLKNKFEYTANVTLEGNPLLLAGLTVNLTECGAWNGKYLIAKATHSVGSGGYTTALELRRCLEGY